MKYNKNHAKGVNAFQTDEKSLYSLWHKALNPLSLDAWCVNQKLPVCTGSQSI
jgi:hypothetical protein